MLRPLSGMFAIWLTAGFAVGRKVTAGSDAASWYWYEAFGTNVVADSVGAGLCASCHAEAPRDNVFTQVQ